MFYRLKRKKKQKIDQVSTIFEIKKEKKFETFQIPMMIKFTILRNAQWFEMIRFWPKCLKRD